MWFSARTSATSTPQRVAAACSSIMRIAAPHWRIGCTKWRTLREPSVSWLPYFFSSPGACADAHARPVGLHLVGDDHRQAGAHAGAHLGAVGDDGHQAGRIDGDEDVRVIDRAARHLAGAGVPGGHRRTRQHTRRRAPARRNRRCPSSRTGGSHSRCRPAAIDVVSNMWVMAYTPVEARRTAAAMR